MKILQLSLANRNAGHEVADTTTGDMSIAYAYSVPAEIVKLTPCPIEDVAVRNPTQ
ncbi:hypothetical protein [Mesorhizobium sp. LNHC229A00]|uniref:hypothetical protein n=1 Tax=Mesorhizobium sp. LNHC229A00 TaxID=1287240 RepID=UPI0003FE4211|nr:hypothetical protein [Mesorhizobium sp. LNHC229A00]